MKQASKMVLETNTFLNNLFDNEKNLQISIYRYKFSTEFMEMLYQFSKIHQYDMRQDFKQAWNIWIEENVDEVNLEIRRLDGLGYDGDILDKMFKSARYYFRKKSSAKKEPKERKIYVSCHKDTLDAMDSDILNGLKTNPEYKPADGFNMFCYKNMDILKEEVQRLIQANMEDSQEIREKIKKTYKNRYFMLISK